MIILNYLSLIKCVVVQLWNKNDRTASICSNSDMQLSSSLPRLSWSFIRIAEMIAKDGNKEGWQKPNSVGGRK